jgi:hypothetical protein
VALILLPLALRAEADELAVVVSCVLADAAVLALFSRFGFFF